MQGLGLYTLEELKFSPFGLLYTRGPSQYKIPAVCDVPLQFNVYLLPDSDNPYAIYSSKVRHKEEDYFQTPQSFSFLLYLLIFVSCAGYWRTHPLLGQFGVLRHQRRRGCCSLRFWFEGTLFSKLPCNTREGLLSLCLPIHSEGNYTCQLHNLEFA